MIKLTFTRDNRSAFASWASVATLFCAGLIAGCGGGGGEAATTAASAPVLQDEGELLSQGDLQAGSAASAATAHYARLNEVRARMGLGTLKWNGALARSAQAHADYLVLNEATGHEETPGAPGFFGESISDRTTAAGYRSSLVQETKAGGQSTTSEQGRERMNALLLAPLHRLQLLAPEFDEIGVGVNAQGGPLVADMGKSGSRSRATARRWMYPFNGQTGVVTEFSPGTEFGLPADMPASTGTPLTLSGFLFSMVSYSSAVLVEEQTGLEVPLIAQSAPGEVRAALIFFPVQPLKAATHYVWKIDATVDRISSTTTAKFVTAE